MKKQPKKTEETIQNTIKLLRFYATYYEKNSQYPDLETTKKGTGLTSQFINAYNDVGFDWDKYKHYYAALSHEILYSLYKQAKEGNINAIKLFLEFVGKENKSSNDIKINVNLLNGDKH